MAKYMVCDGWKNFVNKEEGIPSGISCVMFNTSETASYTLDGKRTTTRQRGINIVRMKDGSIRKIIVK